MTGPFVTTEWLAAHLGDPDVAIVDGSWYLPAASRDPHAEYRAGHIPGAVFFDLDAIADTASGLPHMLLPPDAFARAAGALGIGDGMTIVVYDGDGLFSAPRVAWNFRVMGATAMLLAGGMPKWRAENRPLETGEATPSRATFTTRFDAAGVAGLAEMRDLIRTGGRQIVDARPGPRFTGEAPEPRPGIPSGHMPGAKSMPAMSLTENGVLKSPDAIRALAEAAGVDLGKPIVTTCGSGVTAATLKLALEQAGATDVILYDGSWSEWASRTDTEIVTG